MDGEEKKDKVTMKMIAEKLGLTTGLVSLALNDKYGVNEETRSRIILTAYEMGYGVKRPSKVVRTIIVLVSKLSVVSELFWNDVLVGIETECKGNNCNLHIMSWSNFCSENHLMADIHSLKASGVIIINKCTDSILYKLKETSIPVVVVDYIKPLSSEYNEIKANNYLGGYEAAKYLYSNGHRKIAFFGNIDYSPSFQQRYLGFNVYMLKKDDNESILISGAQINRDTDDIKKLVELSDDYVICNTERLLDVMKKKKISALLCANDMVAKATVECLTSSGYRIPEDISVMSFDNTAICEQTKPKLTAVNVPRIEMGKMSFSILADIIKNKNKVPVSTEVSLNLVERESVKTIV